MTDSGERCSQKGTPEAVRYAGAFARSMYFEDTCRVMAEMGCRDYDVIGPVEGSILKKLGLIPTMYPPGPGGNRGCAQTAGESRSAGESHARGDQ
jgi:hypothetical protein